MTTTLRWHHYRYMPYEKRLAELEVTRLTRMVPQPTEGGLLVKAKLKPEVARRFTYFAEVEDASGSRVRTDQAAFEASTPRNGQKRGSDKDAVLSAASKQATRYSAHGLHEYRGKFNPQVVRATVNILGLKAGSFVLDPFCGSGTVLLEAAHLEFDGGGFDLHPLAVEIANAKIAAFHTPRAELRRVADSVLEALGPALALKGRELIRWLDRNASTSIDNVLPNSEYLRHWFPELVLRQIAFAFGTIERHSPDSLRGIFRVMLSDIVREVSWQEPADLRIRRRANPADNYPALALFAEGMKKKSGVIFATPGTTSNETHQVALLTDSRDASAATRGLRAHFGGRKADAIISSPPYATALPYVDMHRLSLCLLGLIGDRQIREAERSLIGNREITDRERRQLEDRLTANTDCLPPPCHTLCVRMLSEAEKPGNGFRRRNTPSLLYKYLGEMRLMFQSVTGLLKQGAPLAFVIGPNRCSLGGLEFAINTPDLLREIGESAGFVLDECIELGTYQRYGMHHQNSIRSEALLIMRKR
jgi:SAM-dependent methyltransferase